MPSPIYIDTNIPIYAAGRPHPLKQPCADIMRLAAAHPDAFVSSAEVPQEILHHLCAQRRWPQDRDVFDRFMAVMTGRIEPVVEEDLHAAATLADQYLGLSARDLLHVAVMNRVGAVRLASADGDFDVVTGIQRLSPANLSAWRSTVGI